ncbi:MAG: 3-deoxy-7-phosphoheptulonate synthase [Victivallales bacterium]|nr:3-deoxy-7-phosphoheptulonate synthase [Victivallales bacterium]
MIIVFKHNATEEDVKSVSDMIEKLGYEPRVIHGVEHTVIGAVGDEKMHRSLEVFKAFPFVEDVLPIQKRYKLASREFRRNNTVIDIGGHKIGGGNFQIIAGPCSVESLEQMQAVCRDLQPCHIGILRGGTYKPRTSPYDFQGLGEAGLEIMRQIKEEFKMQITTEVVGVNHIAKVAEVADCLQIGARNSQNYNLLEFVAEVGKPVILKRGMASTIEEWLSAAEYLMVHGCTNVILCERGIKTFEHATRNTLDLSAVAIAKKESHLPVIVDPSHAAGRVDLILPLSRAAIAAGADGLLVETHPDPVNACSDAGQQIPSQNFGAYVQALQKVIGAMDLITE